MAKGSKKGTKEVIFGVFWCFLVIFGGSGAAPKHLKITQNWVIFRYFWTCIYSLNRGRYKQYWSDMTK
jgi:hypothetical protein